MLLQLFLNKNLALHFYYSEKSLKGDEIIAENIYLITPGLPSFTHRDFFKDKVNKNVAFFYLYYYGSWFSGGNFLFKNCVKSINDAIDFIKNRQGIKTFDGKKIKWNYENLFLTATSFGGNVVLSAKINKRNIKKIFLYAPFFVEYSEIEDNQKTLKFLTRGYKNVYRGIVSKEWHKYFTKKNKLSFLKLDENFPPIEIIHGKKDIVVSYQSSQKLQKRYSKFIKLKLKKEIGHSFEQLHGTQKRHWD